MSERSKTPSEKHPWRSPKYPRTAIPTYGGETDRETGHAVARTVTSSAVAAYRVVKAADAKSGMLEHLDVPTMLEHLGEQANAVNRGSLEQAEAMLINQATALQALFVRLSERAMSVDTIPPFDANMRFALMAQRQCTKALETLALIKQGPTVIARSANVVNGPQQVNVGGTANDARARGADLNSANGLLEANDGKRLDHGAPSATGCTNRVVEALGAEQRPPHPGGQGEGV
jgi:hypothetical protein